jgi:hypothetical protein
MPKGERNWQTIGDAVERVVERLRVERGANHGSSLLTKGDVLREPAMGQAHEIAAHIDGIEVRGNNRPTIRVYAFNILLSARPCLQPLACGQAAATIPAHFAPNGLDGTCAKDDSAASNQGPRSSGNPIK